MNKLILAISSLLMVACNNAVGPLKISRLAPLEGCAFPKDEGEAAGSAIVDVAAGSPQVVVGVEITGHAYTTQGLALRTGEVLEPKQTNLPTITQFRVQYKSVTRNGMDLKSATGGKQTYPDFVIPVSITFSQENAANLLATAPVPLISAQLGDVLVSQLTADNTLADVIDITAEIEARGEIDASKTPITTGTVSFPIRAVKSNPPACPMAGQQFKRFPYKDASGMRTDFCRYVGQSFPEGPNAYWQFSVAPPPTACCDPGTDGC